MAKRGSKLFTGALADWVPVTTKPKGKVDAADRPLSKPDRVASEQRVLADKYLGDKAKKRSARNVGNPHVDANVEHSELVRAKKKDARDNDTNAKTFVVSANKIVGSQG